MSAANVEVIVVGGGPAGLTAAIALAACAFPIRAQSAAEWIRQGNDALAIRQF